MNKTKSLKASDALLKFWEVQINKSKLNVPVRFKTLHANWTRSLIHAVAEASGFGVVG